MLSTDQSRPSPDATPQRPGGIRGRYAVLATFLIFVLVPALSVGIGLMLTGGIATVDLQYSQRANWFVQPVKPRPLRYNTFVAAETGKEYKKTDLTIDPAVERVLIRCATLAQADDFADNPDTRAVLETYAQDPANGFYPAYLLAAWHKLNGNTTEHETWIQFAFDLASGALIQRMTDAQGNPVAGFDLPPVAIGYDRVIDGRRNASLVLIYPGLTSDNQGMVYVPTYRSVYRFTDADLPLGVDPGLHPRGLSFLPQPLDGRDPNWFAVPDGAVGQLPDAVIID